MGEEKPDRRGTFWDWPVGLMAAAVVLTLIAPSGLLLWALLFVFAGVTLMARRGVFSPRK